MSTSNCIPVQQQQQQQGPVIVGLGNPIMDMIVHVDQELLTRYNLKADDQILVQDDKQLELLHREIQQARDVMYRAGGAVQNTLKILSWLFKHHGLNYRCEMIGAIGNDDRGKLLEQVARKDGLWPHYQLCDGNETGVCAALISGDKQQNRCLVTKLGASQHFKLEHMLSNCLHEVQKADMVYISGFFLSSSPESAIWLAQRCRKQNIPFAFNLSSRFVSECYKDTLDQLFPCVSVLFGNQDEYGALMEKYNQTNGYSQVTEPLLLASRLLSKGSLAVMTQGSDKILTRQDDQCRAFPVPRQTSIVDTIGVGDAFVAGFLFSMIQGKDLDERISQGVQAASKVIQRVGCSIEDDQCCLE